jgi:hypothetical protein
LRRKPLGSTIRRIPARRKLPHPFRDTAPSCRSKIERFIFCDV